MMEPSSGNVEMITMELVIGNVDDCDIARHPGTSMIKRELASDNVEMITMDLVLDTIDDYDITRHPVMLMIMMEFVIW